MISPWTTDGNSSSASSQAIAKCSRLCWGPAYSMSCMIGGVDRDRRIRSTLRDLDTTPHDDTIPTVSFECCSNHLLARHPYRCHLLYSMCTIPFTLEVSVWWLAVYPTYYQISCTCTRGCPAWLWSGAGAGARSFLVMGKVAWLLGGTHSTSWARLNSFYGLDLSFVHFVSRCWTCIFQSLRMSFGRWLFVSSSWWFQNLETLPYYILDRSSADPISARTNFDMVLPMQDWRRMTTAREWNQRYCKSYGPKPDRW